MMDRPADPTLAKIHDMQDAIEKAMANTPRIPESAAEQGRINESARMDGTARSLGVDPDDYRKWCAGASMPHVKAAVLKAAK